MLDEVAVAHPKLVQLVDLRLYLARITYVHVSVDKCVDLLALEARQ